MLVSVFFGDSAVPRMENQPVPLARLQVSPPKASPGVSGFGWVAKDPQISEKTTQAQVVTRNSQRMKFL